MITGVLVKPHYVATAIVLNIIAVVALVRWLRRECQRVPGWQRWALLAALGARTVVAVLVGFVPSPDVEGFKAYSWVITRQLWWFPLDWLHTLGSNQFLFADWKVVYYGMSNTFFFFKVLSVVNLLSLGIISITAWYLSLFCFIGGWQLVRAISRLWPAATPGATVAFVLWPTVVFWTSTFTKESLLLGSGAWLLSLCLQVFYGSSAASRWQLVRWLSGIVLLAGLHFNMRFFFASPLLIGLVALALVRTAQRLGLAQRRAAQVLCFGAVLAVGAWVGPQLSPSFRLNKFTSQMVKVYTHHLSTSQHRPHFEYPNLVPTASSAAAHLPLALVNAFAQPIPGQSKQGLYIAAGFENVLLFGLFGLAIAAAVRRKSAGPLPFAVVLALGLYCLAIALLLGLTTPNLGTLNRYRSAMLPYLLLLLLQNEYAAGLLRRLGLGEPLPPPSAL